MRVHAALILAACLCAPTLPAQAGETFDLFRDICIDAHGDLALPLATADRAGWKAIPDVTLQFLQDNYRLPSAQGRMLSDQRGTTYLLVAHKSLPSYGFAGNFCVFASLPAAEADLEKSVADFAGIDSVFDPKTGMTGYTWRVENGTHVRVPQGDPDLPTLAASGALNMLALRRDPNSSVIFFSVPNEFRLSSGTSQQTDTPSGQ